ncbi:hypothetical protein B0I35DRAFT_445776 [Stachybotrys elegans]|uniref:Rhodopsin domain-containing protein n=1 Tax=Stachybotrys elegans TaxID=80388 RepID=A0A8K0SE72_9HYPO|nr:hypothetical protein B0I35DRAFT_445776 [Stachybotrys elegans]
MPDSNDDDNIGPGFRAYIIVMLTVSLLAVTLRFWSRFLNKELGRSRVRFWWDDWVALAATIVLAGQQAVLIRWVDIGFGRHIWTLPPENIAEFSVLVFASYFLYDTALFLSKASALLFFGRIFPHYTNSTLYNTALWTTHALNLGWLIGIVFGTIFFCSPVSRGWDPTVPGSCGTNTDLFIGSAVPSVVIDFFILLLPLPKIWNLQTSKSTKYAVSVVFVLGYSVIVLSIGRLATVLTSGDALDADITYEAVPVFYWAGAETPITILGICLPAMLPLAQYVGNEFFQPFVHKVSSILSTRGSHASFRSRTGDFDSNLSTNGIGLTIAPTMVARGSERTDNPPTTRSSGESSRRMLMQPNSFFAHVLSHDSHDPERVIPPERSIRVDKDITVKRSAN